MILGILAGEPSGDRLGAGLMRMLAAKLAERGESCRFVGIGGTQMMAAGLESVLPMERLSVNGFVEPVKRLPGLVGVLKTLLATYDELEPDAFLAHYNLHLAQSESFNFTEAEKSLKAAREIDTAQVARLLSSDDGVRPGPRPRLAGVSGNHDELLPETVRVLARELARECVEAAQALHGHQERFIGGEPRVREGRDLLPQVVFQLRDVDRVDCLP